MSLFKDFSAKIEDETTSVHEQQDDSFEAIRASYLNVLRKKALEMQNDGNFDLNEADIRFSTSLNLSKVRNALVAIIGAGGLGNWQWRILAAMGFRRIAIYDDDKVGIENVGPQAHSVFDLDIPKTEAVENAALIYRGIKVIGRNKRVYTYKDICDDLGENPDIVIGCTDSADFRNGFITNLEYLMSHRTSYNDSTQQNVPELFIDYRMSLGDWVAYIIPARSMRSVMDLIRRRAFFAWYKGAAVFSADKAVQEPCTERAIAYTGANVASFTGALLHWFYSGGRAKFHDPDYMLKFMDGDTSMPARKISFSSRDFEFITDTAREKKLSARIKKLQEKIREPYELIRAAFFLPINSELVDSGWGLPVDFYDKYQGKVIVLPGTGDVFICGHRCCLTLFQCEVSTADSETYIIKGGFTRKPQPNIIQPFLVYDMPEYVKRESRTLRLLNAKDGEIFCIDNRSCTQYLRIGNDKLEIITRNSFESEWQYQRVDWEDKYSDLQMFHRMESQEIEEIEENFNILSARYDSNNASHDVEARNQGQAPLNADDLRAGMKVRIGDETCEILSIGANRFKVLEENGEEVNYSLRRMPEIFLVLDEDGEEVN